MAIVKFKGSRKEMMIMTLFSLAQNTEVLQALEQSDPDLLDELMHVAMNIGPDAVKYLEKAGFTPAGQPALQLVV